MVNRSKPFPCHLQIAKTGTNTVRSLISDSVQSQRLLSLKVTDREFDGGIVTVGSRRDDIVQFIKLAQERQWEVDLITVMLPVGLHTVLERKLEYFTFVREPVARCLSAVNFVFNRRDRHPNALLFSKLDWSIPLIAREGGVFFCNDQVRLLTGSSKAQLDETDLELAKENVKSLFYLVGTTENFSACWDLVASRFNLLKDFNRHLNSSDYSDGLVFSNGDREALLAANRLDTALYRWVRDEYLPARLSAGD